MNLKNAVPHKNPPSSPWPNNPKTCLYLHKQSLIRNRASSKHNSEAMSNTFKTKEQLSRELGISPKTLYRRLRKLNLDFGRELLSPEAQILIMKALGFSGEETDSNESTNKNDEPLEPN